MVNLVAKIWTPTLRYLPNMLNLTIFSFSRHECCLWTLKKFKKIMHDHIMIHNLVTIPLHSFNFSLNPTLYQEETSFHWRKNPILTLIWENFHNAEDMSPLFHTQVINSKTNPPCFFYWVTVPSFCHRWSCTSTSHDLRVTWRTWSITWPNSHRHFDRQLVSFW